MINHSGIGPRDYNNLDYWYGRLSFVANLTPDLENYTIFHYSQSDTNGYAAHIFACDPNAKSPLQGGSLVYYEPAIAACDQIARQNARGDGPLDVEVNNPNPFLRLVTFQVINTTTWKASDHITVKNIASYGQFMEHTSFSLNSDNFFVPDTPANRILAPLAGLQIGKPFNYILLDTAPGQGNSDEATVTEELQVQGNSEHFNWVVGGYLEYSNPLGWSAGYTSIYGNCTNTTALECTQPLGFGVISASKTKLDFQNDGIFAQGTYKLNDKFALTVGGRYTFDKITGTSESTRLTMLPNGAIILSCNDPRANGGHAPAQVSDCLVNTGQTFPAGQPVAGSAATLSSDQTIATPKSNKPTWLIDLDYKPNPDMLLYAKYARGYRQGGLTFTNPGLESWGPEKVDTYEAGGKFTLRGPIQGYINVAGFYNDFSDQQIFAGLIAKPTSGIAGGAAIINAGQSEIYGAELDSSFSLTKDLRLDIGYTYLKTKIKQLTAPTLDPTSPFAQIIPNGQVGDPLAYSPEHKVTATGSYTLPLDASIGKITLSATYVYTSSQIVTTGEQALAASIGIPDPGKLDGYGLLNLNLNWDDIAGKPVDLAVFASNVTNEHYRVSIGQSLPSAGFENALYGAPVMYGVRLRYRFGH
jgi:iron complex outermembrane receptor protein